jgi:PucR C-terminal helix-turn-helix domain/GGDEF-like domain
MTINSGRDDNVDLSGYVSRVAEAMHERLGEVASLIRRALEEDIPELRGDAGIAELHRASVEGNVDTLLRALRYDIAVERVEAPTAALEFARRLAQHDVPINALIRAYRLGQRQMNELVFREVRAIDDASVRFAVLEAITATLFEYIDWISQQVVVVYEEERERWLENQNSLRGLRIRELLTSTEPVDTDEASTAVQYPLRWHHLAVVMWYPERSVTGDELSRLQRFARELGHAANASATTLFVASDQTSGWAWLSYRSATPGAVGTVCQAVSSWPNPPNLALGKVLPGVEGFRRSHSNAEAARAVAIAGGHHPPTLISASDPGVSAAALLCRQIGGTREWVTEVLGNLAVDSDNDARLRETLRVFLRCGASYKLAASELGLHFNSVKYRVGRAVARRGRSIAGDRLDVEMALLATQWLGAAVLKSSRVQQP